MRHALASPRHILRIALTVALMATAAAAQAPVHYRRIGDTPGFPRLHEELQRIVDTRNGARRNTFCLMLADDGDGYPLVFAIWRERRLLYRWNQTTAAQVNDEALVQHEPLDLRKDLIRTRSDEASTFLVTRAWAKNVEEQCREHGQLERIERGGLR